MQNSLKPIDHPAAWRGEELFKRPDWQRPLTDEQREQLAAMARGGGASLPDSLLATFAQIQHDLEHGSGACLVKNVPLAGVAEDGARRVFAALSDVIGTRVSQSAAGERIFSVRDEGYGEADTRTRGPNTKKRLSFHTDRCDVIGFLCLRQAQSGGENQLASSVAIYNEMLAHRPDLVEVLMQPYYSRRHNVDTGNERPWCRQPIFSFCEGHFAASYLRVLIDRAYDLPDLPDMTSVQREALDEIERLAADPAMHVTFRLQPGEMLFLNNWVTLHRREQFVDHESPQERRHLLRVWLAVPNSRPIDPLFADNFGDTRAGAIRGGMRAAEGAA